MREPASRSRPAIQEIRERSETFFRLSPAVEGKPQCFAVKRGDLKGRADVHFFKPEFIEAINTLVKSGLEVVPLNELTKDDGEIQNFGAYSLCNLIEFVETGIPFVKVENYDEDGIDWKSTMQITPEVHDQLPKSKLRKSDVFLSMAGTIGLSTVFNEDFEANSNQAIAKIRLSDKRVKPQFLSDFLNCNIGKLQSIRISNGGVQANINLGEIGTILVPVISPKQQDALIGQMETARLARQRKLAAADALLAGLDNYLLSQLGLTPPPSDHRQVFAVRLGELQTSGHANADYFHPERVLAIRAMERNRAKMRVERLLDIADFIRDGVPAETSENYLGLANVQSHTGELVESSEEDAEGLCFRFAPKDVLFARLRPYLNKVHRAEETGVCSTEFHVMRLRPAASPENEIQPDYLATILRSALVLAQTRHMMTGNTHPRLANDDVVNLIVPIPDAKIQSGITAEVARRRTEARRLRAEAATEWTAAKAQFEQKLLGESAKP